MMTVVPNINKSLRPVLQGILRLEDVTVNKICDDDADDKFKDNTNFSSLEKVLIWEGFWWLSDEKDYEISFDDTRKNVIKAPFRFERVKFIPFQVEDESKITSDALFSGSFSMKKTGTEEFVSYTEQNLALRFRETAEDDVFEVVGSGENTFGHYTLEGTFRATTGVLCCARNYFPKEFQNQFKSTQNQVLAVQSPKKNQTQQQKMPSPRKKSTRVKRQSEKIKNFFMEESLKKRKVQSLPDKMPCKFEPFNGFNFIISLIQTLITLDQNDSSFVSGDLEALLQKIQELEFKDVLSVKRNIISIFESTKLRFSKTQNAVHSKSCLSRITRLEKTFLKSFMKHFMLDNFTEAQVLDEIEYLLNNEFYTEADSESSIDPLGKNEFAILPEEFVDIGEKFELNKVFEDELKVSEIDTVSLVELDVETLKQLNKMADFSCPSKGV